MGNSLHSSLGAGAAAQQRQRKFLQPHEAHMPEGCPFCDPNSSAEGISPSQHPTTTSTHKAMTLPCTIPRTLILGRAVASFLAAATKNPQINSAQQILNCLLASPHCLTHCPHSHPSSPSVQSKSRCDGVNHYPYGSPFPCALEDPLCGLRKVHTWWGCHLSRPHTDSFVATRSSTRTDGIPRPSLLNVDPAATTAAAVSLFPLSLFFPFTGP